MAWQTTIYEREKLYQEVWTEPVRDVARSYGLSDVGLAKICQKLGVPVPGRGFWARKAAGEAVKQEPLLPLRRGEVAEHRVERWRDPLDDVPIGSEAEQLLARENNEDLRPTGPRYAPPADPPLCRTPAEVVEEGFHAGAPAAGLPGNCGDRRGP